MQISIANAIGALSRILGIVRKNLQLWLDFEKSEVIGSELVVNGDFATDGTVDSTSYSLGFRITSSQTTGSILSNQFTVNNPSDATGTFGRFWITDGSSSINTLVSGNTYRVSYTVDSSSGLSGGSDFLYYSGSTYKAIPYSNGTHTFTFTISGEYLQFKLIPVDSNIVFSNISVKEVTQFAKDKSPNTNNAKLFTGKALSFDGVNDWVDCGNDSALNLTDNFTLVTTVKLSASLGNGGGVVTRSKGTDDGYGLSIDSNGKFSFPRYTSSSAKSDVAAVVGEVYRVVSVQDSGVNKLYVNGVLQSTMGSQVVTSTTENFVLGRLYGAVNNYYLSGDLSDTQIYNTVWQQSDVTFDYNNPNHLAIDNPDTDLVVTDLKGYWALNEGDGLVAYDSGSTLHEDVVQNGDFSEVGVELQVNNFSTSTTGWGATAATISVNNDELINVSNGSAAYGIASFSSPFDNDKTYIIEGDYRNIDALNAYVAFHDGATQSTITPLNSSTSNSHFKATVTTASTGSAQLKLNSTSSIGENLSVAFSNISVKQVDPNDDWTLGTGWSYGDDRAVAVSGSGAHMTQNIGAESGKQYQVNFDVEVAGGKIYLYGGQYAPTWETITESNSYSFNVTWGNNNPISFYKDSDFVGSITNISVKEITQSAHGSNITPTSGDLIGATYVDKQPTIPQLGMMDWAKGSNLLPYSNDFTEWANNGGTLTPNFAIAPNGNQTASKYNIDGAYRIFRYLLDLSTSTEYTFSFYVKNISSDDATYRIYDNTNAADIIGATSYYSQISTTEWSRVDITFTTSATGTEYGVYMMSGIATGDILFWGAQVEESSSAGNYILTDGAAAIDVTTIENPTNKGYDILGNALRLREHAFNLDGTGYAEVADDDSLDFGTGDFTLEAWVVAKYISSGSSYNTIISLGGSVTATDTAAIVSGNTSFRFLCGGDGSPFVVDTTPYTENEWYHLVAVRSGGVTGFYMNTVAQVGGDSNSSNVTNSSNILIGKDVGANRTYKDLIDEPRIYNRALTLKEITNNYNVGLKTHTNPSSYSGDYSSDYGF